MAPSSAARVITMNRRRFLGAALAASVAASLRPALSLGAAAEIPWTAIGYSQAGVPLIVHHLGADLQSAAPRVLMLGGQHGGPEENTIRLAVMLMDYFAANPSAIPRGIGLDVLLVANPDGKDIGIRQFLSGVDPNRNWPSPEWQSDTYDSNGRFRVGLGGPEPFSEQETRALGDWIMSTHPAYVINYHSAGGFMFGSREGFGNELSAAYADASGYYWPSPQPNQGGRSGSGLLPYRATGSMNVWLRQVGIPGMLMELTTPYDHEYDRNLAGVLAVFARLKEHIG